MKIDYVSHACLYVETPDLSIIMDPWFDEPAYLNQWHLQPKPTAHEILESVDAIVISHGHDDHLHYSTLQKCNKQAEVYYPLQLLPGAGDLFINELGFRALRELQGNKTVSIAADTRITFVPVGHDAVIVLESGDKVLVNINDALHAAPAQVIYDTTAWLKRRFPKIDYMFCGYGGASYFPNCLHTEHKHDVEIARLRECLFARNFCLVAHELQPDIAVPFAADFKLLHDNLRWINDTRFDRTDMGRFYADLFGELGSCLRILPLKPGQALEGGNVTASELGQPDYAASHDCFSESVTEVAEVAGDFTELIRKNLASYSGQLFSFSLAVKGLGQTYYVNAFKEGRKLAVKLSTAPLHGPEVVAEMSVENVEHLLKAPWNSDVIIIGYGIEIRIIDATIADGALRMLERLLTHYPNLREHAWRSPLRSFRYLSGNHRTRSIVGQRLGRRSKYGFKDVERRDWLIRTPAEIALELGIPTEYLGLPRG